MNDTEVE
ncbi:Protein of unknown function [Bacillus cytotoxicus]|nr:Protein of unknown function [Bacillus cytotoxicus]